MAEAFVDFDREHGAELRKITLPKQWEYHSRYPGPMPLSAAGLKRTVLDITTGGYKRKNEHFNWLQDLWAMAAKMKARPNYCATKGFPRSMDRHHIIMLAVCLTAWLQDRSGGRGVVQHFRNVLINFGPFDIGFCESVLVKYFGIPAIQKHTIRAGPEAVKAVDADLVGSQTCTSISNDPQAKGIAQKLGVEPQDLMYLEESDLAGSGLTLPEKVYIRRLRVSAQQGAAAAAARRMQRSATVPPAANRTGISGGDAAKQIGLEFGKGAGRAIGEGVGSQLGKELLTGFP